MHIKNIHTLVARIVENLPSGLLTLPEEVHNQLKLTLQDAFIKMDLVTKEEFSAQQKVLLRAYQKIEKLESLVDALEKKIQ